MRRSEAQENATDYYFSLLSPWAYIGHKLFHKVAASYDRKINYKPVMLGDLFSETGGLPLSKRHPVRQRYRKLELQRWRDKRGLNFHLQPGELAVQRATFDVPAHKQQIRPRNVK